MSYKALALDLDGTLTDHNKKVPENNKKAIDRAIEKGVKIILASGRPLFGITPVARELGLDKKGGYILAYNGGSIIDCKTGKKALYWAICSPGPVVIPRVLSGCTLIPYRKSAILSII